jgi:uncharacterized DUF497 family protein
MKVVWDVAKAKRNQLKHSVKFADAVIALNDELALTVEDQFSRNEARFITIGLDAHSRLLVVVYTHDQEVIRIISARRAGKREKTEYEKGIRFQ